MGLWTFPCWSQSWDLDLLKLFGLNGVFVQGMMESSQSPGPELRTGVKQDLLLLLLYIYIFLVFSSWWCSTFCKSTIQFWRFFLLSVLPHSEAVPSAFPLVSGSRCVFFDPKWHWRSQTQPGSGRFPPLSLPSTWMLLSLEARPLHCLTYLTWHFQHLPTLFATCSLEPEVPEVIQFRMIKNQMFACMIMHDPSNSSHFY